MIIPEQELITLLKDIKVLDDKKLKDVNNFMKNAHLEFTEALLQLNLITDEQLGITIANHLKVPFISLSKISIPEEIFHIVPEKIARKQKVIAFARDETGIKLAMSDPSNKEIGRAHV